ncbi:hypothetical protein CCMSSC00406_0001498 [Pleurotus cornucopiae]|uniref:Uncharacterized protein n=1 Tax=Pleurotus cornucopiae TaxID=5321 RepID=A0ACB7INL3_PLECO|nr:hypothetical protein CCMSSC00406_0001498 [Pleurotus cornucopiae]
MDAPPTGSMPMPNLQLLFGPMLIGVLLNAILYGVLTVQCFIYYQTYTNDKAWIRYLVLYLFFVETLNTGFDIGIIYEPLILRFGTMEAISNIPVMLMSDPIVMVMISTPIQCFIAWRINVISQSKAITAVIVFFSFSSLVGAYSAAITTSVTRSLTYPSLQRMSPAIITWLVSSATADVIITSSLVYHLYKRKTGIRATDDIINRIMRLTIQTGMITALFAALDVISFLAIKNTSMNFLWDFPLSKLYTNSLLSTLNARAGWNNLVVDDQDNVLFGTDNSRTVLRSGATLSSPAFRVGGGDTSGGGRSKSSRTSSNPQKIMTGVYELGTPSLPGAVKEDLEQPGINVTRVVESLQDPLPRQKRSQDYPYTQ